MPIIGLTDTGASFPRIGELRKGDEKPKTGNAPGKDLTYFRFTSKHEKVASVFAHFYPDGNNINIFLPFATTDENFEAWQEEWKSGGLVHRCNGQTAVIWQTPDGKYSQDPIPCPGNCKQVGRLKVIIPELGRLAYVVALTTSKWDISEVHANLTAYEALRGDLRGIPFILSRVPRMISTPTPDGKRARREKWLIHIEAAPDWVNAQLTSMRRAALPSVNDDILMLTDGDFDGYALDYAIEDGKGNSEIFDAEYDDLFAEMVADGGNIEKQIADTLSEFGSMDSVKAGFVADRLVQVGTHDNRHAALNSMRKWDGLGEKALEFSTALLPATAVTIFNDVIQRHSES